MQNSMQDTMQGMTQKNTHASGGWQQNPRALQSARRLSRLMDSSIPIPGLNFRIGLDPILGLIPGIGDAISSVLSSYIVLLAISSGASSWTLVRMVGNIALESVIGALPLVGDLFDAVWKSNERNHRLLEANLISPTAKKADRSVVLLIVSLLIAFVVLASWLAVLLIKWMVSLF